MNRMSVQSSNIAAIGHDGKTLEVEFTNGSVYQYEGVSAETFRKFSESESKGRFFAQNIRALPSKRL